MLAIAFYLYLITNGDDCLPYGFIIINIKISINTLHLTKFNCKSLIVKKFKLNSG